ncbi:uncharacterized protein LOC106054255 [Biomphalaria glabrata]|uniref:Uncharacterized protein LOC106054255 n=1 Tax=Biomphalaria glabrata TaxID=6526 RepID=A0A9W2YF94_BIOGL|nr:uncharacterized protein LOC106054255 [Biomphalaria glabrata]XP_055861408.1 uncharacterized protein LOC106054255 [Biomphalaria glabrata]XP_055861409.1 uncharacterized protein LOC106054255 [Biomphalaria glabrata]XP_055861410.1 uncharacterized protein LOC106054255 [Biomphalaria glabrata]
MNFTASMYANSTTDITAIYNITASTSNLTSAFSPASTTTASMTSHPVTVFLEKYYAVFLLAFGTIGNILSFAVLSRRTFRKTTIAIFLRYLTLADLGALYTGVVYFLGKSLFNYDIRRTNELSCKFHRWLSYVTCDLSSWALVLVSTARLLSIVWPMKRLVTRFRVYMAIIITTVILFLVNLPMFIMYGDYYAPKQTKPKLCTLTSAAYDDFYTYIWGWLVLIKFTLLPGLILVCLNTALIVTVSRTGKAVKNMDEFGGGQHVAAVASTKSAAAKWKKKGTAYKENHGYDSDHPAKAETHQDHSSPLEKNTDNSNVHFNNLEHDVDCLDRDNLYNEKEYLKNKHSGASDEVPLTDLPKISEDIKSKMSKNSFGDTQSQSLDRKDGILIFITNNGSDKVNLSSAAKIDGHGTPDLVLDTGHQDDDFDLDSDIFKELVLCPEAFEKDNVDGSGLTSNTDFETAHRPDSPHHLAITAVLPSDVISGKGSKASCTCDDVSMVSTSSDVTGYPNSIASPSKGSVTKSSKKPGQKKMTTGQKSKSLTRSLLLINTVFLVCTIPISIYLAGRVFIFTGPGYSQAQEVFNIFSNFIMYTNNSINFILYCVSGTRFRKQLQQMMLELYGATKRLALRVMALVRKR